MSLLWTDSSKLIPGQEQPVGGRDLARKLFNRDVPSLSAPARLFVLARRDYSIAARLRIGLNGRQVGEIAIGPGEASTPCWLSIPLTVPPEELLEITLSSDGRWFLPMSAAGPKAGSLASNDDGANWKVEPAGEYIIRLLPTNGRPVQPPSFIHENMDHPRLKSIRESLPDHICKPQMDVFARARLLSSYINSTLLYLNSAQASVYTPWDFDIIMRSDAENRAALASGKAPRHIVMCVHSTVAFITAALSLGMHARCVISTGLFDAANGHCFAEIWLPEIQRWAVIDPTFDFCFFDENGLPKSARDLSEFPEQVRGWLRSGPGQEHLTRDLKTFAEKNILTGDTFRNLGCWPRNDFLSHPEACPTAHGSISYFEPEIVWIRGDDPAIAAFPFDCRESPLEVLIENQIA